MTTNDNNPSRLVNGVILAGLTYLGIRWAAHHFHQGYTGAQNETVDVPHVVVSSTPKGRPATRTYVQPASDTFPLKMGSKGTLVVNLQKVLGVKPDGIFGRNTLAALKKKYNIVSVSKPYYLSIVM